MHSSSGAPPASTTMNFEQYDGGEGVESPLTGQGTSVIEHQAAGKTGPRLFLLPQLQARREVEARLWQNARHRASH